MKVCISTESLSRSNLGSITGAICLSDGNLFFPSEDWDDFVVIILEWWLEALSTPMRLGVQQECSFMDGDFEFHVSSYSLDEWQITCDTNCNDLSTQQITAVVNSSEFMTGLRSTAQSLVTECHNRGWNSQDIDRLNQLCIKLNPVA